MEMVVAEHSGVWNNVMTKRFEHPNSSQGDMKSRFRDQGDVQGCLGRGIHEHADDSSGLVIMKVMSQAEARLSLPCSSLPREFVGLSNRLAANFAC